VIALAGDGGLLFTVAELAMAAELEIPLPVVVPNNGGYGEIRAQMLEQEIDPIGVDLRVPDLPRSGGRSVARACASRTPLRSCPRCGRRLSVRGRR
jgi:thiamine pyrophosphate-dependent acetolactate synthase large subunit-like protein